VRGLGEQHLGEGGLADPRLAADEDERPAPGAGGIEGIAQRRQLTFAADE